VPRLRIRVVSNRSKCFEKFYQQTLQEIMRQPNRWKISFFGLAAGALCVISYMGIRLWNQSDTIAMVSDGLERREQTLSLLRKCLPELSRSSNGLSQKEILAVLQKHTQGTRIISGPTSIEIDQMKFCFAPDGSLDRVEKTDDYGTRVDFPTNRPTIPER
jgi:hypothetical protein